MWEDLLTASASPSLSMCYAISVRIASQIACKMSGLWYPPLTMGNGILSCKERHPLLLKCFITFLRCIRKMGGAYDSIYKFLIDHIVSFLSRPTLKLHTKYNTRFGVPSLHRKRGWYTVRVSVVVHYCWNGSKASVDTWGIYEENLKASGSHL